MLPSPGEVSFTRQSIRFHLFPPYRFGILGGGSFPPQGTFTEYIVVERDQVFLTLEHLDDVHIAAWPVGGLTAWRYRKHFFSPHHTVHITLLSYTLPEPLPSMPKSNMDRIFL